MNIDEFIYVAEDRLDKDFCKHCIEKFKKDDTKYQGKLNWHPVLYKYLDHL